METHMCTVDYGFLVCHAHCILKWLTHLTNLASAVAWSGRNEYELASASLDTTVKLWDIRGAVPNHTIKAHEGKVLCVGFCRSGADLSLVSGGEDGKMRTFALGKA